MTDGLHVASPEEVKAGRVTDVYFLRGEDVLRAENENPQVVAEVRASVLPREWPWGVFAGLEEALWLLEGRGTESGRGIEVQAVPEGGHPAPGAHPGRIGKPGLLPARGDGLPGVG